MLFSKIQMPELKTSGMYVQMASIVFYDVMDSYIWLKIFRFKIGKYHSHSSFNTQLSWRKTFATFSPNLFSEPLGMLKIFVEHLSLIVSSTAFWLIQTSKRIFFSFYWLFEKHQCLSVYVNDWPFWIKDCMKVQLNVRLCANCIIVCL